MWRSTIMWRCSVGGGAADPPWPMPSWSACRWPRCCSACTASTAGSASPTAGSGICSGTCQASPAVTSGCALLRRCWLPRSATRRAAARRARLAAAAGCHPVPCAGSRQTVPRQPQRRPVMDQAGLLQPQRPARPGTPRRPHPHGAFTRTAQRLLAVADAIWHNWATGAPDKPSLLLSSPRRDLACSELA